MSVSLWSVIVLTVLCFAKAKNLMEIVNEMPELSEFSALVKADSLMELKMRTDSVTVFAPDNEAMRRMNSSIEKLRYLALYHISNEKMNLNELQKKQYIHSDMSGNLKLWINEKGSNTVTVNNADIVKRDIEGLAETDSEQVLHVIDRVLEPLVPTSSGNVVKNPDAKHLLLHTDVYGMDFVIPKFRETVEDLNLKGLFSDSPEATYFIPSGSRQKLHGINEEVIRGHIIPNEVLFLRTMVPGDRYHSKNGNTFIALEDKKGRSSNSVIKSITERGAEKNMEGVVTVNVTRANIPVKNGVVHFIDGPLVLVTKHIKDLLKADTRIQKFAELDSKQLKIYDEDITLLAPINKAFQCLANESSSKSDFLQWHVISHRCLKLYHSSNPHETRETDCRNCSLSCDSFEWKNEHNRRWLVVEGGGVTANVLEDNLAATNGILHVIDRLLGVPYKSMISQIENEPDLKYTSILMRDSIEDIGDEKNTFTVLAPTDEAWGKELFEKLYVKQPGRIKLLDDVLNRHVIYDDDLPMEHMVSMSKKSPVETAEAQIIVRRSANGGYEVEWDGIVAKVIKYGMTCARGRLHVIDKVFITEEERRREVTVSPTQTTQTRPDKSSTVPVNDGRTEASRSGSQANTGCLLLTLICVMAHF